MQELSACDPFSDQGDPFQSLFEQARKAHNQEIARLKREVRSLRSKLATTRAELQRQGNLDPIKEEEKEDSSPDVPPQFEIEGLSDSRDAAGPSSSPLPLVSQPHGDSQPVASEGVDVGATDAGATQAVTSAGSVTSATSLSAGSSLRSDGERSKSGLSFSKRSIQREQRKREDMDGLKRRVLTPQWEVFWASVIALNGVFMAFQAQYEGFDLAVQVDHSSKSHEGEDVWPSARDAFDAFGWIFGMMFSIEITVKLLALRCDFVKKAWNWVDLIIVLLWVYSRFNFGDLPINTQIVRLFRLSRMLRLIRLVKFMQGQKFDSLYLMTTALKGSMAILAWTLLFLLVMHLMFALFLNQLLRELYFDTAHPGKARLVYQYFGSFSRSFLTMFEITLANWPVPCRVLIENVSEWFIIYAVLHKMALGFAVIGVVNGVFIQETFKVATLDDSVMLRQTIRKRKIHEQKMLKLFEEADSDANGYITLEEFRKICDDEWVKVWLASQEIGVRDANMLFHLLDAASDGDGQISAEELVQGAARLKGPASTIELLSLMHSLREHLDAAKRDAPHQRSFSD